MRVLLLVMMLASIANADAPTQPLRAVSSVQVVDPDGATDEKTIFDAVRTSDIAPLLDSCPHMAGARVLVWMVFDGGKPTTIDAAGSGDRKLEACVTKALRTAKIVSKARVAASFMLRNPRLDTTMGIVTTLGGNVAANGPVDPGASTTPLTADQISHVMTGHAAAFRACYTKRLKDAPTLQGKVVVSFTVTSGFVTRSSVSTKLDDALDACLVHELKELKFPAGTATVNYPFVFTSQ